ncbi:MAG: MgtC/SapB family protein [Gemmatimonadetes bacterium]|nr:MgtC/SapB family protein [Gemmatimonadota bacterium]
MDTSGVTEFNLGFLQLHLMARLAVAGLLGAVIGLEREMAGKEAGLRTMILICLGAALFAELSVVLAGGIGDPSRVSANIVTGIGFLGAGAILRVEGYVKGLTTAATIWVVAAIGMAAGSGEYVRAAGTTILVLLILFPLGWWERRQLSSGSRPGG